MVLSGVVLWVPATSSSQCRRERYMIQEKASRPVGLSGAREWFRVCFAVSFFRLDHSFRGGDFFKGGRVPQAHGPAARAGQIVAVGRKGDARNGSVMPVQR